MRKMLCLLLGLLLMCPCALSENDTSSTPAEEATGFVFRNGVTWGMTLEEVQAQEGREADTTEPFTDYVTASVYYRVPVSRYTANSLYYLFAEGALFLTNYEIALDLLASDAERDADYTYLTNALSSLYGKANEIAPETISAFMRGITGRNDDFTGTRCLEWKAADGTIIWQFLFNDRYIEIFYISPAFDFAQIGVYDTTGL